jgi:aminopeptidase
MNDPRVRRWAETLTRYCANVQSGDRVLLRSSPGAEPLLRSLYETCLDAGAFPVVKLEMDGLHEILLKNGSDVQLQEPDPFEKLSDDFNVSFGIMCAENTRHLSGVDPSRQRVYASARSEILERRMQRMATGDLRTCLTLYPTLAYAQEAEMSLSEYEEFVFNACFLNDEDPIRRWKEIGVRQQRYVDALKGKKTVRILARDTDLTFSIEGRSFVNSDGKRNFPSGEFFTGPAEDSANGWIRYSFPAVTGGREIEGIRLRFEAGRVVEARADRNEAYLLEMLNLDEGARRLGEFAFGSNFNVTRFTREILFDEKIGGTVHLALGRSYPETGGKNKSALHWDMICDLRSPAHGGVADGGEVWVDDALFLKDGEFLALN